MKLMKKAFYWLLLACLAGACSPTPAQTPTALPSPTALPMATVTVTASATPTATPTPSVTASATITTTPTSTYTPTVTVTPSLTPQPTVGFVFDNWQQVDIPADIRDGIQSPLIVYTNTNDQTTISNIATASPENTQEFVYFVSPGNPASAVEILRLDSAAGGQIFLAANGGGIAYFRLDGLYILNLQIGLGGRIAAMTSLQQRGIRSDPVWAPDASQLAVTLDTGYALDIYSYDNQGSGRVNLTDSPAYDFYPAWSPDGRYLAFVSDRTTCPSWTPGDIDACDSLSAAAPYGGQVYVLEIATGNLSQVGDVFTTEPARWINNRQLVIAGGDATDLLQPSRELYLADTDRFTPRRVVLPGDESAQYLSDAWSPDGTRVLVQRVTDTSSDLLMLNTNGTLIQERNEELSFPRFGMSAAWSALSNRLAIGGVRGACPYGVRVTDPNFDFVATGNPPPSMCSPVYAADGNSLAFTGVNPRVDGRVDVYSASANGFEATNLTANLKGQMTLLGWVGGQTP